MKLVNLTPHSNWVVAGDNRAGLISGECPTDEERSLLLPCCFVDCRIMRKEDSRSDVKFPFKDTPDLTDLANLADMLLHRLMKDELVYVHGGKDVGRANLVCGYVMMMGNKKAPVSNVIALLSAGLLSRQLGKVNNTFNSTSQYQAMKMFDEVTKRDDLLRKLTEYGVKYDPLDSYKSLVKKADDYNKKTLIEKLKERGVELKGDESLKKIMTLVEEHNSKVKLV